MTADLPPSDLAHLPAFLAVAERLSFSRAADALGVKPSALSHGMRVLEERLGAQLFNRTTRSVSLTPAGQALAARLGPAIGGALKGRYTVPGDHIDHVDNTGFTADGDFVDDVLHHAGMVLRRVPEGKQPRDASTPGTRQR